MFAMITFFFLKFRRLAFIQMTTKYLIEQAQSESQG